MEPLESINNFPNGTVVLESLSLLQLQSVLEDGVTRAMQKIQQNKQNKHLFPPHDQSTVKPLVH